MANRRLKMDPLEKVTEEVIHSTDFCPELIKIEESHDENRHEINSQPSDAKREEEPPINPKFDDIKDETKLDCNVEECKESDSDDDNYTFEMFLDSFCNFYNKSGNPNFDEQLQCDQCDRILNSKSSWHRHRRIHAGEKFQCRFCEKSFSDASNRRTHEYIHNNESHFKCPYCSRLFKSFSSCIRHTKRICKYIPSDRSQIKKAIDCRNKIDMEAEIIQLFKCDQCDGVFAQQSMFELHKTTHYPEDGNRCKFCTKPLNTRNARYKHQKNCAARFDQANEVIECDENDPLDSNQESDITDEINQMRSTDAEVIKDDTLNDEEEIASEFTAKCPYCNKLFRSFSACIRHTKDRCEYKPNDPAEIKRAIKLPNVNNEFKFQCPYCARLYTNQSACIRHTKWKCMYRPSDCSQMKKVIDCRKAIPTQSFKCNKCDGVFAPRSMFELHQTTHRDRKQTQFRCKFCTKSLTSGCCRSRHQKKCAARFERANEVDECDKLQESESNSQMCLSKDDNKTDEMSKDEPLNDEERIALSDIKSQNTEKPSEFTSKCPYCERLFTSFSACIRHTKERCGYKPNDPADVKRAIKLQKGNTIFRCRFCDKSFKHSTNCRVHEMTHSLELHFKCPYCSKYFKSHSACIKHKTHYCPLKPMDPMQTKQAIDLRKQIDDTIQSFKCHECKSIFGLQSMLELHEKTHYANDKKHYSVHLGDQQENEPDEMETDEINDDGERRDDLELNEAMARNDGDKNTDKSFQCNDCGQTFDSRKKIYRHKRIHAGVSYPCNFCEKVFNDPDYRRNHEVTHKTMNFECPYCGKLFKNYSSSVRHTRRICQFIPSDPSQIQKVIKHQLESEQSEATNRFDCDETTFHQEMEIDQILQGGRHGVCVRNDNDADFEQTHDPLESVANGVLNTLIKFEMDEEYENTNNSPDFNSDSIVGIKTEFNETIKVEPLEDFNEVDEMPFFNNVEPNTTDNLQMSYASDIIDPIDMDHCAVENSEPFVSAQAVSTIFECYFCYEQFDSGDKLKRHKQIHIGETYRCRFCDKHFYDSASWRTHELTHSNEMNFQCPYCTKLFKSYSACIRHTKSTCKFRALDGGQIKKAIDLRKSAQVFDRLFKCLHCDSIYGSKYMLVIHQNNLHTKRAFRCKFCAKEFLHASSCCKHQKKCTHQPSKECPQTESVSNEEVTNSIEIDENDLKNVLAQIDGQELSNRDGSVERDRDSLRESREPFVSTGLMQIPNEMPFSKNDEITDTLDACSEKPLDNAIQHDDTISEQTHPPYQCRFCGKYSNKRSNWRAHETTHANEMNFECPYCSKLFKSLSGCVRHKNTKCSWRPTEKKLKKFSIDRRKERKTDESVDEIFWCEYCDSAYRSEMMLAQHEKIHNKIFAQRRLHHE